MVASKNSNFQRCAELLIDVTKIKCKTKSYIFHCGFCMTEWNQLKKFTKHLEEEHLTNFKNDLPDTVPEQMELEHSNISFDQIDIKEEQIYIDESNKDSLINKSEHSDDVSCSTIKRENNDINEICPNVFADPLMSVKSENPLDEEPTKLTCDDVAEQETIKAIEKVDEPEYTLDSSSDECSESNFEMSTSKNESYNFNESAQMFNQHEQYSTIAQGLVSYGIHSDSETDNSYPEKCKKGRKTFFAEKNKKFREAGKQYFGKRKTKSWDYEVPKKPREIKQRCSCKQSKYGTFKCETFTDEERKCIFQNFWQMNWQEKKVYVKDLVTSLPTKRSQERKHDQEPRRKQSLVYYLIKQDERHKIESEPISKKNISKRKGKSKKTIQKKPDVPKRVKRYTTLDPNSLMAVSKRVIKDILPELITQYKKYEILWKIDHIEFGVKPRKIQTFVKIAEELNTNLKRNLNFKEINRHIKYLNQLYSKDKKQELLCKMENKEFIPESRFYTEMSFLCDSQGPFLCMICNEMVHKYDPYCNHMAQHNGTQPFKCSACGLQFKHFNKFVIHKKRHLGIHKFHCQICGKGYMFQSELDGHLTSHTGFKPFLCAICGEGFRARAHHADHMLRHENRFRHECYICKKGFNQSTKLKSHIKSHLNIRDICSICNASFKDLKRHITNFHGKKCTGDTRKTQPISF